jgi:hypothetical protein
MSICREAVAMSFFSGKMVAVLPLGDFMLILNLLSFLKKEKVSALVTMFTTRQKKVTGNNNSNNNDDNGSILGQ